MPQVTELKVRGYHVDVFRHVNNARYLEFLEDARWTFMESRPALDLLAERGYVFMVVNININFRYAAGLNDELIIETFAPGFGKKSAVMRQEIRLKKDGTLVVDVENTFVIADGETGKALPLEGELRAAFEGD